MLFRTVAYVWVMTEFGGDWDRFENHHLGEWHGRSLALSAQAQLLLSCQYLLQSTTIIRSKTNPENVHLTFQVQLTDSEPAEPVSASIRYNLSSFHVFADGTYSSDHSFPEIPLLVPEDHAQPQSGIQFTLPISSTERVRCFLLYDAQRNLQTVLLLEEVRASLFDTRQPLALTSLVGKWCGQAETFRHETDSKRAVGFGKSNSPTSRAKRQYSDEDLPQQLKNPSGSDDGLLKTKTTVNFGWYPSSGKLRRSTVLQDMQDHELLHTVTHGAAQDCGLFDCAVFDQGTPSETIMLILSNACFVLAPMKRVRGVSVAAELGCLITPGFRRRITRMYGRSVVASETLASESMS